MSLFMFILYFLLFRASGIIQLNVWFTCVFILTLFLFICQILFNNLFFIEELVVKLTIVKREQLIDNKREFMTFLLVIFFWHFGNVINKLFNSIPL